MIDVLRPASQGGIMPYEIREVLGLKALDRIAQGQELRWTQLGTP
jgi:sialic acid synthase SpsE